MKKKHYLCLLTLAFIMLFALSACNTSASAGCHRMTVWWTDSDGQVVKQFTDGHRYTANIQIEAIRSHEDLQICLSRELLNNGITVKPNGGQGKFTVSIADITGATLTSTVSFGSTEGQTDPVSISYINGTARLENEYPQSIADENLFALGVMVGNTAADGNLPKGESCRITFDVMIEAHPEPAPDNTDNATSDDHSPLLMVICGVLMVAMLVSLAIAVYRNKNLHEHNVMLSRANESLLNTNKALREHEVELSEAKHHCYELECKLNYLNRGISEGIAAKLGADGFTIPNLNGVVSCVDGNVIEIAHLADQIRVLRARIGMYLADYEHDDMIIIGALLLGSALGIVTPDVAIYDQGGCLSHQAKIELQKVFDQIGQYIPDTPDEPDSGEPDGPIIEC